MQHTLRSEISTQGTGLHSGKTVTLTIKPASADEGIVFIRSDLSGQDNRIPARYDYVVDTQLCTVIANAAGASIGTIEHVMSALRGLEIDNAVVEVDAPEVPIMDGSAMPFVALIQQAGIQKQDTPRQVIRILQDVVLEKDGKYASLKPYNGSVFAGVIDFSDETIGRQDFSVELLNGNFVHDIAMARTFCLEKDIDFMRQNNLALGGSLENAIVVGAKGVKNADGLRYTDEFIRHKLLDSIGDLALAGHKILGAYDGYKPGHMMNYELLKVLFSNEGNYTIESEAAIGSKAVATEYAQTQSA